MDAPRLLDLYCGAGGAGYGYHQAGFEVVGVDIVNQPHYPFEFVCADALEYIEQHGSEFDAIHASPPCQVNSILGSIWRAQDGYGYDDKHNDMIPVTRQALIKNGKPYVIENVIGASLINPSMLCGTMFGLRMFRHRLFETSFLLLAPTHVPHTAMGLSAPRTSRPPDYSNGEVWSVYGHFSGVDGAKEAMGTDWMTRDELAQAIPPAYTRYIGQQLYKVVTNGRQ